MWPICRPRRTGVGRGRRNPLSWGGSTPDAKCAYSDAKGSIADSTGGKGTPSGRNGAGDSTAAEMKYQLLHSCYGLGGCSGRRGPRAGRERREKEEVRHAKHVRGGTWLAGWFDG